ncbi:MAG TPA: hypothetical protein VER55_03830 [Ardenticatenaceae bacterium]|nr:hypothetical protein [Ardenticatenaceae bacterium]
MTMTEEDEALADALPDIVNALAVSPDFEQDALCFAARNSGLYRSDDGGRSWRGAYASLQLDAPLPTTAVAVSPAFPSDRTVFAGVGGAVLRTTDGGETWQVGTLPAPPPLVTTLVVSPNFERDGVVLAGTMEDGVLRSADRGRSWAAWNFGLLDLSVLCMTISPNFAEDETLFAGTTSGLFRSTNGGRAWREVAFEPDWAPVLSVALSPQFAADGVLYVGTEFSGVFSSRDWGGTWTGQGQDLMAGAVNGIMLAPQFPTRPDVLVLLSDGLLVSRDGGASWSEWQSGLRFEQSTASVAAPRGLEPGAPLLVGLVEGGVVQL